MLRSITSGMLARACLALLASSATLTACGDDDDDSSPSSGGRGGAGGTGGTSAKGGSNTGGSGVGGARGGSGGVIGTGGSKAQGGTSSGGTEIGGAAGEAGSAGDGGVAGSAGEAGSGGAAGASGAAGAAGAAGSAGSGGEGGGSSVDLCRGVELPAGKYFVHDGLCVRAVASDQGKLRQLAFDAEGSLLGVTVDGAVKRYRDLDDDGTFQSAGEVVEIANTGGNGNNLHLASGYLYAGTPTGVKRWSYSTTSNALGVGQDVIVGQPSTGNHTFHTAHVYDGWLYVSSGSADNVSAPATPEYDTNRSVLKRFALANFTPGTPFEWTAGEVFVRGIRNMVGFTRNQAGRMYGVVNGMDDLIYSNQDVHLNNPGEDLISIESGTAHGYPYCFTASHILVNSLVVNPGTQLAGSITGFVNPRTDAWCADNSTPPVTFLPPHSAPLDLTFFDTAPAGGLPETFRGGAFVALHGSWNTTPSVGHQIVFVPFNANGTAAKPTADQTTTTFPFTVVFGGGNPSGATPGTWGWQKGALGETPVRPAGVAISPVDGALYVSSDNSTGTNQGYVYRIALQR